MIGQQEIEALMKHQSELLNLISMLQQQIADIQADRLAAQRSIAFLMQCVKILSNNQGLDMIVEDNFHLIDGELGGELLETLYPIFEGAESS